MKTARSRSSRDRAPPYDCKAEFSRNPVDRGNRHQYHQNQERHLLPFQHTDLFGQLQADATDAARLDLALGRPVLVVDSTDVDAAGTPLMTKRTRFAAERIEFVVENN